MTAVSPEVGWVALFIRTAREYGVESVDPIRQQLLRLSGEMFSGKELTVYHALQDLISSGRPPGIGELMAHDPEITMEDIARYHQHEGMFSSLAGATDAVIRRSEGRLIHGKLVAAQEAVKKGDLALARVLMAEGSAEAPSRGLQEHSGFKGLVFNLQSEKRITTGLTRLDALLGGGVGAGGRTAMSVWVAGTSIGKSTFMLGVPVRHWIAQGHWVFYFTGEASSEEILYEVARMHARVKYTELEYARRNDTPRVKEQMQKAIDDLAALPGRLIPYDEAFTDATIRMLAAARKKELENAKAAGEAHPDAELIVVVDNLDNAIDAMDSRAREDQIYNQAARRFVLDARQNEYHLALLHQTNADGEKRNGPPLKSDVAAAKAIVNHAAFMVTLYRPTTTEDFEATEKRGDSVVPGRRARHWIAVRKARGGKADEIEANSDPMTGVWFDPAYDTPAF